MPEKIADGKGGGTLLEITNDNRANVSSKSSRRIYYASRDLQSAYSVNWACTPSLAGAANVIGYLTYSGNKNLYIDRIYLSTEESTGNLTKFGLWADSTFALGTLTTTSNLNLTSSLTTDVTTYHDANGGAGAITTSGGSSVGTVRLSGSGTFEWIYDGALILGNGNTFGIKATGVSATALTRATIHFWEEKK